MGILDGILIIMIIIGKLLSSLHIPWISRLMNLAINSRIKKII